MNLLVSRISFGFVFVSYASVGWGQTRFSLGELDLRGVEQEYGLPKRDRSVDGNPLRIAGKTYERGIGVHAGSRMDVRVDGNGRRFRATVGVDDEVSGEGTVRFVVMGDRRRLFDSGVMRKGVAKDVDVDLTSIRNLRLVVEDAGDGISFDHADWGDPVLFLVDGKRTPRVATVEGDPTMAIAPVDLVKTAIHGPRSIGGTPGKPFLFRVPATGQGTLKFSYRGLPKGISAAGNVLKGTVPPAGRYPFEAIVSGPKGTDRRRYTIVSGRRLLAQTPPMGWNSWSVWGTSVTGAQVRGAADAFVRLRLADFGYNYVNIDDAWEAGRDAKGEIQTNEKFGNLPAVAAYVHGLGLKFGIYSSPGPKTCGDDFEGSFGHEAQDAATYGRWGVDFLKYDWCSYGQISKGETQKELEAPYRTMRDGLDAASRDIVYSLCQYGMGRVWEWGKDAGGDLWRTSGDITDTWRSMSANGFSNADRGGKVGPAAWNDPDMLVVGRLGWGPSLHATRLTGNEQILHVTLWSMLAAPLLISCDLSQVDDFTRRLLMNHDVIEVDQDSLGRAGKRVFQDDDAEIWTRPLADGSFAVAFFNRGPVSLSIATNWARDLSTKGPLKVRDLWQRRELGKKASGYSAVVPGHGAVFLRVSKA